MRHARCPLCSLLPHRFHLRTRDSQAGSHKTGHIPGIAVVMKLTAALHYEPAASSSALYVVTENSTFCFIISCQLRLVSLISSYIFYAITGRNRNCTATGCRLGLSINVNVLLRLCQTSDPFPRLPFHHSAYSTRQSKD